MKGGLIIKKNYTRGISTLEIIIALAVLSITFTALILLSFSNQTLTLDTDLNNHGLSLASREFEALRGKSFTDFNGIIATSSVITNTDEGLYSGLYTKTLLVSDVTPCRKQVSQILSWQSGKRPQSITLASFFGSKSILSKLGNDCGGSMLPGSLWDLTKQESFSLPAPEITGMDVKNGIIYATASTTPDVSNFFTYDIKNGSASSLNTGMPQEVDVAGNYAYVANASSTEQFEIIDTNVPILLASLTIPGVTNGLGRSVFYYDTKAYLGTQRLLPSAQNEFHIFDVSDPGNPIWQGSLKINRNVNHIVVQGNIAYLATGPGSTAPFTPLKIVDISDPYFPTLLSSGSAPGEKSGLSLAVLGQKLYLGRERGKSDGSEPEFLIFDIRDPKNIPPAFGYFVDGDVTEILASGNLVYLGVCVKCGTQKEANEMEIWDVSDPSKAVAIGKVSFSFRISGLDYENNRVYASLQNGAVVAISPQ
ncbi:MAG: hypothetical protein PHV93_01795 [Candidatus Pacebacteria bacterium]|nr:hypothetical protein [Candidatus Paceibacterota bacterium]